MADEDTPPKLPESQCRVFGDDPVPRCARPAAPSTPSNAAPPRPHKPPTRIQEAAAVVSRQRQRVGPIAGPLLLIFQHHASASTP